MYLPPPDLTDCIKGIATYARAAATQVVLHPVDTARNLRRAAKDAARRTMYRRSLGW